MVNVNNQMGRRAELQNSVDCLRDRNLLKSDKHLDWGSAPSGAAYFAPSTPFTISEEVLGRGAIILVFIKMWR